MSTSCQWKQFGLTCPEPLWDTTDGLCILHSRDPQKDRALFNTRIKQKLHRQDCNFIGVFFPDPVDFSGKILADANFRWAQFMAEADFSGAQFKAEANFSGAQFTGDANFSDTDFAASVEFIEAQFRGSAAFTDAQFRDGAYFSEAQFTGEAEFRRAEFSGESYLVGAKFSAHAYFIGSQFKMHANFAEAQFNADAYFRGAQFAGEADFSLAQLKGKAGFSEARFVAEADFSGADFTGIANFIGATFEQPSRVRFHQVNKYTPQGLRARFLNCDGIEGIRFEDVNWHRHEGRMVLQDELDVSAGNELVAIAYRRLVNNFQRVRNYDLAEDCFIGAMEMKRRDPAQPWFSRLVVTLYRLASYYGSSYQRAFLVLVILLVLFAAFFVPAGLRPYEGSVSAPALCGWKALWAGLIHSLEVASFQRVTGYVVMGDFGRLVAVFERVLVPAQVALLLLALRRRFRR